MQNFLKKLFGTYHDRQKKRIWPIVEQINALEDQMKACSDEALRAKTEEFKKRIAEHMSKETFLNPSVSEWYDLSMDERHAERKRRQKYQQVILDEILPEAFAVVREAGRRTLNMRHFDVQLMGGVVLHEGKIAEMTTGEGKTLVATLPVYLNALTGRGVHVVTVNDYLARRDARWMGPLYHFLGLSIGAIQGVDPSDPSANKGRSLSFIFDPDFEAENDRFNQLRTCTRREAYQADITYGQNNEFGFDYLRDNMRFSNAELTQAEYAFAVVDEVDSILVDEARTPLIISGPSEQSTDLYERLDKVVPKLKVEEDFEIDEKQHTVALTEEGVQHCEELLGVENLYDETHMRLVHHINQALRAYHLFKRDVDYVVKNDEIIIVDEFTGRLMPGRRWSDGLHQAVEAKERVDIRQENQTLASVTFQNYFRMYDKLAGMTGTASTEAQEFKEIYQLDVVSVPTNKPLRRDNMADIVFKTEAEKFVAVVLEVIDMHRQGRPVLIGTISIEKSELLSRMLQDPSPLMNRLAQHAKRAQQELAKESVSQEIKKPLKDWFERPLQAQEDEAESWIKSFTDAAPKSELVYRLEEMHLVLQAINTVKKGLDHRVLNAKFHEHEARIIAQAGRKGAVTIATNMAGRGTDIILGGNPEALADDEARDIERRQESEVSQEQYAELLRKYRAVCAEEGQAVKAAGGLHVLGTERHESRRIDNQLRGRTGRQGDPGSSRFYLSLADDLMRIFGGERVSKMMDMKMFSWEEGMPLESGIVTKSIAHAQKQVEGHNFEIRKQLLEYDNTMNRQREVIYEQRHRILEGVDLKGLVKNIITETTDGLVDQYAPPKLHPDAWEIDKMQQAARQQFGVEMKIKAEGTRENLYEEVGAAFISAYEKKIEEIGSEMMEQIQTRVLISTVDMKWKDHLYMMDALREGIGLRAYGQRNPLVEYQREAYRMFQDLIASVKTEALMMLLRIQPASEAAPVSVFARTPFKEEHPDAAQFTPDTDSEGGQRLQAAQGPVQTSGSQSGEKPRVDVSQLINPKQTRRQPSGIPQAAAAKKVGRNEPCPCGSGKKFKKCCGA